MKETHKRSAPQADSFRHYLHQISRYPLLSPDEEITLSRRVQRMMELQAEERPLTTAERREVFLGQRAREQMINSNLRLVVFVAKRYATRCKFLALDDLVSAGAVGLNRAVQKFDHTRGYKFSTYAFQWIRQSITRTIYDQERAIRLPVHAEEALSRVRAVLGEYHREHHRYPSVAWLSEQTGILPDTIARLLRMDQYPNSTDRIIEGDLRLIDVLQAPEETEPVMRESMAMLHELLQDLTPRERDVIHLRYGFGDLEGRPMTLQGIATRHGVSRERIRQVVIEAERKLRVMAHMRPEVRELVTA